MGLLNRIGIGSAEVDTILERETVQPGESVPARIEIEGGSDDQKVGEIDLAVMTRYEVDSDEGPSHRNVAIRETELTDGFTIKEGEQRTMDAGEIKIPESTPPTLGKTKVWVYTGLDIDWSVDPKDKDYLDVQPGPYISSLLDAVDELGFRQHTVDNTYLPNVGPHKFTQEFEFRPSSGPYSGKLDEIEVFPVRQGESLQAMVEVDKRGSSLLNRDESHHRITITTTETRQIKNKLQNLIDEQL